MTKISASFPKGPREFRGKDKNSPKEFFYGTNNLNKKYSVNYVNSRSEPKTLFLKCLLFLESILNRYTQFGVYRTRVILNKKHYKNANVIISFTDAYSLNLGLFFKKNNNQKLIGVFHGLSDFSSRVPFFIKYIFSYLVKKSLSNLNHCLFLSSADLKNVRERYNIPKYKSGKFIFGVDHVFWKPINFSDEYFDILCVGSDQNRDYEILKKINQNVKIKLLSSIKINLQNYKNIEKISGDFSKSFISDKELRDLYNSAKIIFIPIKDVFQPSGQSVALQAMSCGKPVIITKTKGIFDEKSLRDNFNIFFYKQNSISYLNKLILNLLEDNLLREKIGFQARKTVIQNFTLRHMSNCLEEVIINLTKKLPNI